MERVFTFRPEMPLVGVYTEPKKSVGNRPTVVFLTAGLLHKVGPYRFHVDFARHLAQLGYPCFRVDLSGVGDSFTRKDALNYEERSVQDIQATLDFLRQTKSQERFILFGLCSGADNGHPTALVDKRVVGCIWLDAHGYKTNQYYLKHYLPKLFNPKKVIQFILKKISGKKQESVFAGDTFSREFPPKTQVAAEIHSLLQRNTELMYIYTGGVGDYYNYAGQFFDMFPEFIGNPHLQENYLPQTDHTFTLLKDRQLLLQMMTQWLGEKFSEY